MQFSSFNSGIGAVSAFPNQKFIADWKAWLECCAIVDAPGDDPTGGAVMYHSVELSSPSWPAWATPEKLTAHIGPFRFYLA